MATREGRELITEYWFRKALLSSSLIISADVLKIVLEFSDEYDLFDRSTLIKTCDIDESERILSSKLQFTGYGTVTAKKGRIYHWKLKVDKSTVCGNIGIVPLNKIEPAKDFAASFWSYGYSYYGFNGRVFGDDIENGSIKYGHPYGKGGPNFFDMYHDFTEQQVIEWKKLNDKDDIIDVWLDLQNENTVRWCKNGISFGEMIKVKVNSDYKLAVNASQGQIELISFEVKYQKN